MKYEISKDRKTLTITADKSERIALQKMEGISIVTDNCMFDILEPLICNSELQWIDPSETGDLTNAPMLGIRNDQQPPEVIERWAFMDYQVRSVLEDLRDTGKAVFVS